jgi:hypothetical protein
MSKWWMTQIVGQAGSIHNIWVNTQSLRHLATNLSNF